MILGHLTLTYAVREPLKKRLKILEPLGPLVFGAYLPDLIDKPLHMFFDLPGRGIGHSAIFLLFLFSVAAFAVPKFRKAALTVLLGSFVHLLQDGAALSVVLWPFLGSRPPTESHGLLENIYDYYINFDDPTLLAFEVLSYPFCAYFAFFRKDTSAIEPKIGEEVYNTES